MSNEMKTGNMPSVSTNKNVGGENKKAAYVDPQALASQSNSRSRGGYMDLEDGTVNPMQPGC